jgi:hypothetical protein
LCINWLVFARSPSNVVGTAPLSVLFCTPGIVAVAGTAGASAAPPGRPPAGGPPPPPSGLAGGPPPAGCPEGVPPPGGPECPSP